MLCYAKLLETFYVSKRPQDFPHLHVTAFYVLIQIIMMYPNLPHKVCGTTKSSNLAYLPLA